MLMLAAGHQMGKAQAQQQMQAQAQQQAAAAQAQSAAPATKDTTAELQKLADLHKQGVLTDEEFAAMKKKLLGL
jgi:membrane protease subunit (stomatin/prohibitin family)